MNVLIGAKTDQGRRSNNEDQLAVVDVRRHRLQADGILMVADGMGGRQLGEEAAAIAVETIQETLIEILAQKQTPQADLAEALASALRKANARVYEKSRRSETSHGMGTTCVAAVIREQTLYIAHAGDSRAYLFKNGQMARITDDHSYVAEQVRAGVITEEGAKSSRFRNVITRAIGIEPTIAPDVACHEINPGDSLLLCSDGLTNAVSDDDIAQTVNYAPSPQAAADRLIQIAIRAGGKDNITAIVARFETGNRTEQMQAEDLFSMISKRESAQKKQPEEESSADLPAKNLNWHPSPSSVRWAAAFLVIALLLLWSGLLLSAVLRQGGRLSPVPPFIAETPRPVASSMPSAQPDLANLTYLAPTLFYVKPVQGGFLSYNPKSSALTAVTLDNEVVELSPAGAVISLSKAAPKTATGQLPVFPADSDQYVAIDPQQNFYITQTINKEIVKYSPRFTPLGVIHGLTDPTAIAVAPDGTIFVVDNERLKVIRPLTPH